MEKSQGKQSFEMRKILASFLNVSSKCLVDALAGRKFIEFEINSNILSKGFKSIIWKLGFSS